ncbi:MAG: hypothetical protein JWP09_521 [Candidatus Taylorbacteria bacterium]|nr:hypothetical protein [Candidatus Taylorbacteria bacterium]
MNKHPKRFGRLVWYASALSLITVAIAIAASWLLYDYTVKLLTNNLRQRLLTISITQAANIDANDLADLQTKDDWKKPAWSRVVTKLHKAKYSNNDIVFMYIFRKVKDDPTKMEFVADADSLDPFANDTVNSLKNVDVNRDGKVEPDGPDKLQWPGQAYDEAADIPETKTAYDGPLTAADLYTDEYGTVLTGYAPIRDNAGNVVAILGTDIKADDFASVTRQTLYPFVGFIGFLVFIILGLSLVLVYIWRKQATDLMQLNKRQETLNQELTTTNEKLKEQDEQKTEFISLASHQLRGPLTSIKGFASMMLEGDFGELTVAIKSGIETIFKSSQSLVVLVGDYLDVSRMDQGRMKYDFSDFDLRKVAEQVVNEMKPNIKISGLEFKSEVDQTSDLFVHGDEGKIKQVISNLIDNSIKYTPKGWIDLTVKRDNRDKILILIKDSGVGIDEKVIPKLFDRFTRAPDASKTNIQGTGLGLYVAKKMVEAHRGRIWVESPGKGLGSTFTMELDALHKDKTEFNQKIEAKIAEVDKELGE